MNLLDSKNKICSLEKSLEEKTEINAEREKLVKQVKYLQDYLTESEAKYTASLSRGKDMDKRKIKLSKQVSDFEQILIIERDKFVKERENY